MIKTPLTNGNKIKELIESTCRLSVSRLKMLNSPDSSRPWEVWAETKETLSEEPIGFTEKALPCSRLITLPTDVFLNPKQNREFSFGF